MSENESTPMTPSIPAVETPAALVSQPAPQVELPVLPEPDIQLMDLEFRCLTDEQLERPIERED